MFNIGAAELILILLIAFVVVGPKDLPKIARALGCFVRYIRNMVEEVKRETGFDEVAEELKGVGRDVKQTVKEADIRPDLQSIRKNVLNTMQNLSVRGLSLRAELDGILRAIYDAVGVLVDALPASPDKLLRLIKANK